MLKLPVSYCFPTIFKCPQPEGWAAQHCAVPQGKEKGCCGTSGETARALPPADTTNIAPRSLPWNRISETDFKLACLSWKGIYIKQVGCRSQLFFQLPLGLQAHLFNSCECCSVQHTCTGNKSCIHLLFLWHNIWMLAVITTWPVYLKQLYSQDRWKSHQRKRNAQKTLERFEPSLDQA